MYYYDFIDLFNNVDKENFYQEDFFELIEKYNVYVRIDNEQIEELLGNNFLLNIILKNKKIVNKYGETIKKSSLKIQKMQQLNLSLLKHGTSSK